MPERTQKSYLGDANTRLQRGLDLDGLLGLGWLDEIRPVVIVEDATRPGMNAQRNRAWVYGQQQAAGGGPVGFFVNGAAFALTCSQKQVIDRLEFQSELTDAADIAAVALYRPGAAAPLVPNIQATKFIEDFNGDLAPVTTIVGVAGNPAVADWAFTVGLNQATVAGPAGNAIAIPLRMSLLPGATLYIAFTIAAAGLCRLTVHGRTF